MSRHAELHAALMLLTRLPVKPVGGETPSMADSRWAFPLAGAVVGAISALVFWLAGVLGLGPFAVALLAIGAGVLATGGLHEDGLADLADGLGGGATKDRKLEIMRDSRIGSYGVLALILSLGLITAGIVEAAPVFWAFIAIGVASRAAMAAALILLPPVRDDGLGHAASGGRADGTIMVIGAMAALALLPLGWSAIVVAGGVILGAGVVARLAMKQLGGQTGDVLGATQKAAEIGGWLALAMVC
ncbi:hypothetical protein ACMU_15670 [Actibacterium mucosum KCTC 23349]|uniref:Adenosylcobinamide-GDP ribazoletransferase n=1 Tax=Actibacterium mucosum KCTC 23349 TaxID=1454373 RepID=A0A037ZGC4_9RHOB|nr:adenosylcobinamide-GDP ribazoletransferase [Actibacterium mucosum]KAJ55193.1 hypothetical protein ACMU_15670 [Actibacterium mucosum KCTC 23349]